MVFSPDILKSILSSQIAGGPAQACHYATVITPPNAMGGLAAIPATLALATLIEQSQLPGRMFTTTDHIMYGTRVKMPYGVAYDDLTLTFIATNNMGERWFFDTWQSIISDPSNNYFNYYDNYVSDIHIVKLRPDGPSPTGIPTYVVSIEEAYPVAVQAQELSYDAESYMKLSVTFAYRRWRNLSDRVLGGGSAPVEGATGDPFGITPTRPTTPTED